MGGTSVETTAEEPPAKKAKTAGKATAEEGQAKAAKNAKGSAKGGSGLSKEELLKGAAEDNAVGKKVESVTADEIENLIANSGAITAADLPEDKPLQSGQKVLCLKKNDSQYYKSEILERRWRADEKQWAYYVHYLDFNRRLDQWVTPNLILLKGDEKMITADMVAKVCRTDRCTAPTAATDYCADGCIIQCCDRLPHYCRTVCCAAAPLQSCTVALALSIYVSTRYL